LTEVMFLMAIGEVTSVSVAGLLDSTGDNLRDGVHAKMLDIMDTKSVVGFDFDGVSLVSTRSLSKRSGAGGLVVAAVTTDGR